MNEANTENEPINLIFTLVIIYNEIIWVLPFNSEEIIEIQKDLEENKDFILIWDIWNYYEKTRKALLDIIEDFETWDERDIILQVINYLIDVENEIVSIIENKSQDISKNNLQYYKDMEKAEKKQEWDLDDQLDQQLDDLD